MDKIREIYKAVIEETKYMNHVNQVTENEIQRLLIADKERMSEREYEEYRGKIYQILAVAEEETFLVGFRYGIRLLLESCGYIDLVKNFDNL